MGMSACPTCGTQYDFGVMICPKDGTPLTSWKEPVTGEFDPVIGSKIGDYTVEKRVAQGGMGIVYRAVHSVIGRQVAVKVLRPEMAANEQQVERFLAEAKAISAIRHRGIVNVENFGKLPDGRQYMVMEFLEGEPLDVVLAREGPLAYNVGLPLLDEMLDALSAAHGAGVIHRDLKPSNVFLARQSNGSKQVKLVDFGLAKQTPLGDVNAQAFARASLVAGTPEYISPEQIRGEAPTARTDLYGFAVVAFEVLTHKLPFVGQTVVDTLEMHARRTPPHVKVFRGDVPAALDDLVFRLMAKRQEDRPASAEAARQELQRLMREMNIDTSLQPRDAPTSPSLPEIPSLRRPQGSPQRRTALGFALGAAALCAVGVGAFYMGRSPSAAPVQPPVAVPPAPVAKVDPPPVPGPGPVGTTPATDPTAPVAQVDPPDPGDDDPLPSMQKGKKATVKKRAFAEFDGLSDDAWREAMRKRLEKSWKRLAVKAAKADSPTDTARMMYDPLMRSVLTARGQSERRALSQKVVKWEETFVK
jgi:eukaryotic-like serine/threonine-protein kinase